MNSATSIKQVTHPILRQSLEPTSSGGKTTEEVSQKPFNLTEVGEESIQMLADQISKLLVSKIRDIVHREVTLRGLMASPDTDKRLAAYVASTVPRAVSIQDPLVGGREANTPRYEYASRANSRPTWTDDTFDPY